MVWKGFGTSAAASGQALDFGPITKQYVNILDSEEMTLPGHSCELFGPLLLGALRSFV